MEFKKIFDSIFRRRGNVIQRKDVSHVTLAKMRLASHPEAKPQSLMKLSRHDWEGIVARVAENKNTPSEILSELSSHGHPDVRVALTENISTPPEILMLLAMDEHVDVRYSLAENHNAPLSVLAILSEDENPYVADRAVKTLGRLRQTRFKNTAWFPIMRPQKQQNLG